MRTGPSIFQRQDGRWEARFPKERNANGRIVYGFIYGISREEAERKRDEMFNGLMPDTNVLRSSLEEYDAIEESAGCSSKKKEIIQLPKRMMPFTDEQVFLLEHYFKDNATPVNLCFYLQLHLGLSLGEICALRYSGIDLAKKTLTVRNSVAVKTKQQQPLESEKKTRKLPIPDYVLDYIIQIYHDGETPDSFIFTGKEKQYAEPNMVLLAFRKITKRTLGSVLATPDSLRSTYIKQMLENGLNVQTVSKLTGLSIKTLTKRFSPYIKAHPEAVLNINNPYVDSETVKKAPPQMNLLIFGAGSHGHSVKEVAESLGIFQEIKFLDDNITGEDIIGTCASYKNHIDRFPCCFIAIGNNEIRKKFTELARSCGYLIPRLISNEITLSKNAIVGAGTIIMPQATVNAATIGEGCIVASNALIGFGSTIGDFSHVDIGGLVNKGATVPNLTYIDSGEIYK